MYNNGGMNAGMFTGGGGLAMTGMTGNLLWLLLTGFALVALGLAVLRTVPRAEC